MWDSRQIIGILCLAAFVMVASQVFIHASSFHFVAP
jgi:hypothetical protein